MQQDSITRILEEIQRGSIEAAEQLYAEYQPLVLRVVRRHLSRDLRRIADSVDFSQAVWKTLFEHAAFLQECSNREVAAAYIARVASNKVHSEMRAQMSRKRDIRRTSDALSGDARACLSHDPSPSQSAMAKERLDAICSELNPIQRQMIEQRIAGYNIDEIAMNLGISERTVRRVLKRLSLAHE